MGKYKVGIETKEKIYEAAKILFYEHGYTSTTCLKIAKESGANVGLINYYFGSKGGLGILIYDEIMYAYKNLVKEKLDAANIETTLLVQTAVEMRIHHHNIRMNKNFSRFYYDLLAENVIYKEHSVMTDFYDKLAKSCDLHFSDFEIAFITYANMGATQGANLAYDAGLIDCSSVDFVNASIHLLLSNMGLHNDIIADVIEKSSKIEKQVQVHMEKNFNIY